MDGPRVLLASLALAFVPVAASSGASLDAPEWDAPAFSIEAKTLAASASRVKASEGDDAVFLYEEDSYRYDDTGAAVHTYHALYRVISKEGLQRWPSVSCLWQPWRQDKPAIRARVVSRDGIESILDPRTLSDGTAYRIDRDLYSDSRILEAPLPNLEIGCVVEVENVTVDRAPLVDGGSSLRIWFGHSAPVLSRRLVVDCPASTPLRYLVRGTESAVVSRRESEGRLQVSFDVSDLQALPNAESALPPDVVPMPCVDFSTGSSWTEVARVYAALCEGVISRDSLKGYLDGAADGAGSHGSRTAGGLSPAERFALVAKILYRIRAGVRYTGIGFGQNAIVPYAPLETLSRGYGDCKDQAALLVAALRTVDIDARIALLSSGFAADILPSLPGFGQFNHAIVYLPSDGLWIDPTSTFSRPGELPPMDQGRRALVISADTLALQLTPESLPSDNFFSEVREFRLSESGPAAVVETTTMTGSIEASYRDRFERNDSKTQRESLERYVKGVYDSKSLASFSITDPRSMDERFTLRLEAREAKRGFTGDSSSTVAIQSGSLLDFLPAFLTRADDADKSFERKNEVLLAEPFVSEYTYRISSPPGYRAAALPEDNELDLGPATLTATFRLQPDGSVVAVTRFDCVKRRYSPSEAAALHAGVRKFLEGPAVTITFEQVGESLLAESKYREALEEFRNLAALHPAEALHHMQISRALMAAGFKRDAVKEADKAVELEPGLARPHAQRAWCLLHDDFGRFYKMGADLESARAEYTRAMELDPLDFNHAYNLAVTYEYDESMVRYGPTAKLEEAVRLYRSISKNIKGTDSWNNLAVDLLRLGRFREMKEELKDSTTNQARKALFVAACAVIDGPAVAQREAARLAGSTEERGKVLGQAAQTLLVTRRYAECAELMAAGARLASSMTQALILAEILKGLVPVTPAAREESSPKGLILSLIEAFFTTRNEPGDLSRYFAASAQSGLTDPALRESFASFFGMTRGKVQQFPYAPEIILDIIRRFLSVDVVNEGPAFVVLFSFPELFTSPPGILYVKREGGVFRAVDSSGGLGGVFREILALLDAGLTEDALCWIRLLRMQHTWKSALPDLSANPIFSLLPKGFSAPSEAMRLAAGYTLTGSKIPADAELGASIVLPRWRVETDKKIKRLLSRPLAEALLSAKRNKELLEVTEYLVDAVRDDTRAVELRCIALTREGKGDEAEALMRAQVARLPEEPAWTRLLSRWLAGAGRYSEALALENKIVDSGRAELVDYNDLGWYSLYVEDPDPDLQDLVDRRKLVSRLMGGKNSELHTLACLLGEAGRTSEAQEVLGKYLEARDVAMPDSSAWLAYGIMAERFGLSETAGLALAKVLPEPDSPFPGIMPYALARKHLERLAH